MREHNNFDYIEMFGKFQDSTNLANCRMEPFIKFSCYFRHNSYRWCDLMVLFIFNESQNLLGCVDEISKTVRVTPELFKHPLLQKLIKEDSLSMERETACCPRRGLANISRKSAVYNFLLGKLVCPKCGSEITFLEPDNVQRNKTVSIVTHKISSRVKWLKSIFKIK